MNSMKKKILTSITVCIIIGIIANIFLMYRFGRAHIIEESSSSIQNVGNNLVYRILSRIREYEAVVKSLSGVSNELWVKREQLQGAITHMLKKNQDTRIRAVSVFSSSEENVEHWHRGDTRSWTKLSVKKAELESFEWYHVAENLDKNILYWNRGVLQEGDDLPTVTGIYKSELEDGHFLVVAMDLQLNGLNAITERLEKEIGGAYIFITDQSNQFLILSEKMKAEYKAKGGELLSTSSFTEKEPLFSSVSDAFNRMTDSVLRAAEQMPSYDPSKSERMAASGFVAKDYTDLTISILMDPLIRATFTERFVINDDFIIKEPSSVYSFFVPETYWKLAIVVPCSYESAVATKITRLFYIFWIGGALLFLFIFSYFLNRFMRKPIDEASYQIEVYNNSLEKSNWNQLKDMASKEYPYSEIGEVQQRMTQFLNKVIIYHEKNKKDKEQVEHELKNIQKNRDKVLDRCEELDKENKQLQLKLQNYHDQREDEMEELGDREKEQQESFNNVVRNLKGLRLQLIPIWEEIIFIPHVVNLLAENFEEELERLAVRLNNASCSYLLLSLSVFPFDDKKQAAGKIVELTRALNFMGIQCIFISVPPAVAQHIASLGDLNFPLYSEQSISKALVQAWRLQDEVSSATKDQINRIS